MGLNAMVVEVAWWGTPICPRVGVFCLMTAVTLSHRLRQLMRARRCWEVCMWGGDASLAESFYFNLLRFRDTDEVK